MEKSNKIKVRPKKKKEIKKKATKELKVKIRRGKRRDITIDDKEIQHLLIGKPRKIKDAEELINFFNAYILTCLEKKRKYEIVPIKTVDTKGLLEEIEPESDDLTLEEEITEGKASKKEWGKQEITNKLESKYEIKETIERKQTPSIGGFLTFLGWLSYRTWERYRDSEDLWPTVEQIDNYLESVIIDQAAKWKYNSGIAQFILNVKYNRIPKNKVDQTIQGDVFNESDFIKD